VDNGGRIYVVDTKEPRVLIFDSTGAYIKSFGKKGQGPGELADPFSISITSRNEIMIPDYSNRRLAFYSPEGEFIKNISIAKGNLVDAKMDDKGNFIGIVLKTENENPRYELTKFDPDMNNPIVIASSPMPGINSFNPFLAVLRWDLAANHQIVCGYPEKYEIQIMDQDGKKVKTISREYDPVKVTEEEKARFKGGLPSIELSIPKYHPAFNQIYVDDELRIFVLTWEKNEDGEFYYDVFSWEGKYITRVNIKGTPQIWKKRKLYTIEEDKNGYQYVKRYNIKWDD
jgi:hypothetical protein